MEAEDAAADLKVCVVGPACGKTLLCQALAEQPIAPGVHEPTVGVRVQEVAANVGAQREPVRAALWDVSSSPQYRKHWETLAQGLDGLLLVVDPARADECERELEACYLRFAQPHALTTRQCMVLALDARGAAAAVGGTAAWPGLKGKLGRLQSALVSVSANAPEAGAQEARRHIEKLLAGCLARKRDLASRAVLGEGAEQ
ncbi:hypothetical protein Rsub_05954 [Raphidocelis subcapitata]|uniref:Uncharacterized protein n=1 Tax=Raphidocelis subcapitata TaxID=307507 RepID=A0A2V0P2U4_9CHLO|nr:hypothetical protein Rsub_05954 [Raphidocelis subcapitata]|eukprot:GBF93222.1 hypothetical protein Rsub_05954 [Raphidocelis subcapitata]